MTTKNLLDIIRMVLIDAVVAEMHARVPEVLVGLVILHRGKPHKALLIQVDEERVYGGHAHVQTEVAFMTSDQKRLVYIFCYYHVLAFWDLFRLWNKVLGLICGVLENRLH